MYAPCIHPYRGVHMDIGVPVFILPLPFKNRTPQNPEEKADEEEFYIPPLSDWVWGSLVKSGRGLSHQLRDTGELLAEVGFKLGLSL